MYPLGTLVCSFSSFIQPFSDVVWTNSRKVEDKCREIGKTADKGGITADKQQTMFEKWQKNL